MQNSLFLLQWWPTPLASTHRTYPRGMAPLSGLKNLPIPVIKSRKCKYENKRRKSSLDIFAHYLWIKCPLWVNQPDQLSLPSLQGLCGWGPSNSRPGLRVAVWLPVKVHGRGLGSRPNDCTPALSVTQKRCVICLCLNCESQA